MQDDPSSISGNSAGMPREQEAVLDEDVQLTHRIDEDRHGHRPMTVPHPFMTDVVVESASAFHVDALRVQAEASQIEVSHIRRPVRLVVVDH